MRRASAVIGLLLIVACGILRARAQESDPLRLHHERAQSFQLAGDLSRAETEYRVEVLPRALRRLGNLSGAEGRVDEAVELLDEAARLAPADPDIQVDRAVAWLRKRDLPRAAKFAQDTVAAAPGNPRALSLLGRIFILSGNPSGAVPHLRSALDSEARFETAFALALASLHLQRLEAARALFDQMKIANATPDLLVLIGRAYLETGFPALALEEINAALARNPGTREAHYYSGLAHLSSDEPDRLALARSAFEAELRGNSSHGPSRSALSAIAAARDTPPKLTAPLLLFDLLPTATATDRPRREQMRAQLQQVLASAWHNLAVIHERSGEAAAAAFARERAARWSTPTTETAAARVDIKSVLRDAESLVQAGNLEAAERILAPALDQQPNLPAALRVLGLIRASEGRFDEAEGLLRRAAEGDPGEHAALATLARTYVARGEYQRAIRVLDRMPQELQPGAAAVRLRACLGAGRVSEARALIPQVSATADVDEGAAAAEALLDRELVAEANALMDRLAARGEPTAALFVTMARVRLRRNDRAGAETLLERALSLEPNSVDALQLLARTASTRGDHSRATDLLLRAREHDPKSPAVLRQLVEAAARAARLEEALAAARQLGALTPNDPEARRLLALTLLQNQDWREAIAILESPPPGASADPKWALALGMAHFGRRDHEAARRAFERALTLEPDLIEARFHLGLIAREQGRTTEALTGLSEVLARDPAHKAAHLEIGTLYLALNDLGRARRHLECAAWLDLTDPTPHYQLALLARREGDMPRARAEMQNFQEKRQNSLAGTPTDVVQSASRKGGC